MKCLQCFVSGRVQGVFYRASTRQQAQLLGVTGYAKNLPDQRVEVLACGSEDALHRLQAWLWLGPQHAQVTDVKCHNVEPVECPRSFATL